MSTYKVYADNEEVVLSKLRELDFEVFHPSTRKWPDVLAKKNGRLLVVEVKTVHGNGFQFPKGQLSYLNNIAEFLGGNSVVFLVFAEKNIRVMKEKTFVTLVKINKGKRIWWRKDEARELSVPFSTWYKLVWAITDQTVQVRKKT